jgi:hypothetical protein
MRLQAILALAALSALAGCGGDEAVAPTETSAAKFDQFCSMTGLTSPPRTTVVLIDSSAITASAPEKFRETNPTLFALVMGLGDPERAVTTGAVAPRERLTVLIGDPVSGSIKPLFTGCVPGISATELAARSAGGQDGTLSKYFGSDAASTLTKSRDDFRKSLLVALVSAKPGNRLPATDTVETSTLARLMRAVGAGTAADAATVRRLFIYTSPDRSIPSKLGSYKEAREAGFAAAERVGADLGRSEVHIVPATGTIGDLDEAFLSAFVLGSAADLRGVSGFSAEGLSQAPTQIYDYAGELPLSSEVKSPLELRLAVTETGELVDSWISYTGAKGERATPISGHFDCTDDDHCILRGDPNAGLGQRWRTEPGSAPQPLLGGPFGGLRMIEAQDHDGHLTGRIFDPVIFVGTTGDLKFDAKRLEKPKGSIKG